MQIEILNREKVIVWVRPLLLFWVISLFSCSKGNAANEQVAGDKISLSADNFVVDSRGGTVYVTVNADKDIKLTSAKQWVDAEYDKNASSDNLKIHIAENTTESDRAMDLQVEAADGSTKKITISQKSKNYPAGEETNGVHVKVANYNIRVDAAADAASNNGWEMRKEPLTEIMQSYDLDIIGMQEANPVQLADVVNLLPGYTYVSYPYGGKNGTSHNAAIVYKQSKFDILDKGEFWYSATPEAESVGWDATDLRICTWAKMKDKADGQEFYFFTSHFYYQYATAKQNSGKVMVDQIKKITQGSLPVISTGDLNSGPSTPQVQTILNLLKDSYRVTETSPVGLYNTTFHGGVFKGAPVYRTDYIFVSNDIRVLTYDVSVSSYNDGRYPSDHLPVICDLLIKK